MKKNLFIIAGANGSGKTTISTELLKKYSVEFLNADEIAKSLNPENLESMKIKAGKIFIKKLNDLLKNNRSIALESTLSGKFLLKFINKANKQGYDTTIIYCYVANPEICINRIKVRTSTGGHFVPDVDVIRRFHRSINNFWFIYKDIVDEWIVFYNGLECFLPVIKGDTRSLEIIDETLYNQFKEHLK